MTSLSLDFAKMELTLAGRDQAKLAAWAEKWGEDMLREIDDAIHDGPDMYEGD